MAQVGNGRVFRGKIEPAIPFLSGDAALAYFLPAPYRDPAFQIIAITAFTGGMIPTKFSMIAMAAASLILLVPYYIATVRVERKVVEARHPEIDPKRIAVAVRWAHRLTYSVLALLVL
jgi:hypothetical protein